MSMKERDRNLVVRMANDELAMAHALADDRDETVSRIVRKLLVDAYVARFGVTPPATKSKAAR